MRTTTLTHQPAALQRLSLIAAGAALALAGSLIVVQPTVAQAGTIGTVEGDLGTYLVDGAGNTIYYFKPDPVGTSVCTDGCLEAWPAVIAPDDGDPVGDAGVTGTLGAITRGDGTRQATYRGRPLYYYVADAAPGDTNGQGQGEVWWVAAEDGSIPNPDAVAEPELILETASSDVGTFLVGVDGLTTYYFEPDTTPGESVCADSCLEAWPPVTVADGISVAAGEGVPGVIGVTTATDGSSQVTYDGRPLYYFVADEAAGDTNGHGQGDVWWVATIDGTLPG